MKKAVLILGIALCGFTVQSELSVKASIQDWQKHINKLEVIRQIADESNLTNQQVKFITRTIDSLEFLIIPQLQKQVDTTKKK